MEMIVRIGTAGKPEILITEGSKVLLTVPEHLYKSAVELARATHKPAVITKTEVRSIR